jgi:argininosuccinate lyase
MIDQKKFVFIESNTTGTGELLMQKAFAKNLCPIFITSDPSKYSFSFTDGIEIVVLDTSNKEILYDYLLQIKNIIAVYSSSEMYVEVASWLAEKLGLPGTNSQTVRLCRDKYSLYQVLAASKIKVPFTKKVTDLVEAENALGEYVFPIVIKPNNATGSSGVKLCEDSEASLEQVRLLLKNNYKEILIQEYIEAPEFSAEVFSFSGQHYILGVTKKYLSNLPYFVEAGHDFPAQLPDRDESIIKKNIILLLSTLNYNFGFSHMEFKVQKGEMTLIEVNPRLAGGMIPRLIEKASGVDILDYLLDVYSNQQKTIAIECNKFASIRHLIPANSGEILCLKLKNPESVDEFKILKKPGENFHPQGNFKDRAAYIIVSDTDVNRCLSRANQALDSFDFHIENRENNFA